MSLNIKTIKNKNICSCEVDFWVRNIPLSYQVLIFHKHTHTLSVCNDGAIFGIWILAYKIKCMISKEIITWCWNGSIHCLSRYLDEQFHYNRSLIVELIFDLRPRYLLIEHQTKFKKKCLHFNFNMVTSSEENIKKKEL